MIYWLIVVCSAAADPGDSLYGLYEDLLNVQDYDVDNIELNTSRQGRCFYV